MDMKFASFVEVYFEDKAPRLKERSIMTKRILFETKIIPYFGEKQMNEIKQTGRGAKAPLLRL